MYSTAQMPHLGKRSADFEETPRDIVWFSVQNLHIYRFIYKFRKLKPVINLIEKTVPFTRYNNSKSRKKNLFCEDRLRSVLHTIILVLQVYGGNH